MAQFDCIERSKPMDVKLGSVYVFNLFNEPVGSLSINGFNAGTISGLSTEASSLYTPAQLVVPRVKHHDELTGAGFVDGENSVIIEWVSDRATLTLIIPGESHVSLLDDLILYLAKTKAILLNTRGYILKIFDI
jgi:hypothetical protein